MDTKDITIKIRYRYKDRFSVTDDPVYTMTVPSIGIKIKGTDVEERGFAIVCSDDDVRPSIGHFVQEVLSLYFEKEKENEDEV